MTQWHREWHRHLCSFKSFNIGRLLPPRWYRSCQIVFSLPPIHFRADYYHCSMFWWEGNVTAHASWHAGHVPDMSFFYRMSFLLFCHDKRWEQVTVPCVWQGKSIFVIYRALRRDRGCAQLCFGHWGDKRCAGGLLSEAGAAWVMLTGCWFARVATMRP